MSLKNKYPYITGMNEKDILDDLLENTDELDTRTSKLENIQHYQHCITLQIVYTGENAYQSAIVINITNTIKEHFTRKTFADYMNSLVWDKSIDNTDQYALTGTGFIMYVGGNYSGYSGYLWNTYFVKDTTFSTTKMQFRFLVQDITASPIRQVMFYLDHFETDVTDVTISFYDNVIPIE